MNKRRQSINELTNVVVSMAEKFLMLKSTREHDVTYWLKIKEDAERIADEASARIAESEQVH